MNVRRLVSTIVGSLVLSGAAGALNAADRMGMHGMMGEGDQNMMGMHGMGMHGTMMGYGDQKVSKEEYLKHAQERFARMDANKDGVIDASDRAAMYKRMQDCMGDGMMMGPGMMGPGTPGAPQSPGGAPQQ